MEPFLLQSQDQLIAVFGDDSLSTLGMILPFSIGMSSAVDGEIAPPINKTPLQYGRDVKGFSIKKKLKLTFQ